MSADKMPLSSVLAFAEALNGQRGDLDAWLECNNEAEVRANVRAYAAEQTRELVEALELAESYIAPRVLYTHGPAETQLLPALRALIAKHKEQA